MLLKNLCCFNVMTVVSYSVESKIQCIYSTNLLAPTRTQISNSSRCRWIQLLCHRSGSTDENWWSSEQSGSLWIPIYRLGILEWELDWACFNLTRSTSPASGNVDQPYGQPWPPGVPRPTTIISLFLIGQLKKRMMPVVCQLMVEK